MSDSNPEMDQLTSELVTTWKQIDREMSQLSYHWGINRPFPIYVVTPNAIALLYGTFLAVCFGVGIVLTFHSGTLASLGVALVVGALFAGGAVVGQIWSFAIQERRHLFEKAFGDERTKDLENLGRKFWQLKTQRDHLRDELQGEKGEQQK
jgi:hypothetical protein